MILLLAEASEAEKICLLCSVYLTWQHVHAAIHFLLMDAAIKQASFILAFPLSFPAKCFCQRLLLIYQFQQNGIVFRDFYF